jgi:purine-binding chemotaxis protein CheW
MSEQETLVMFWLAGRAYALPVEPIVQIIPMVTIVPVPQMGDVLEGVINVRGQAVPVVDLRRHLGLPAGPLQLHTPILLIRVGERVVGLIVDEVSDVLALDGGRIVRPVDVLPEELRELPILRGLGHVAEGVMLILDPEHLFRPEQADALARAAEYVDHLLAEGGEALWPVDGLPDAPVDGTGAECGS